MYLFLVGREGRGTWEKAQMCSLNNWNDRAFDNQIYIDLNCS